MSNGKDKPPSLVSLPGGKHRATGGGKPKGRGRRVSMEIWQQMDEWWVKSVRSPYELARRFQVAATTAEQIVHKGYPKRGLPPLKQRAAEYDAKILSRTSTTTTTEDEALTREANEWARTKRTNITAIRNTRGLIGVIQNELVTRWRHGGEGDNRPLEKMNPQDMRSSVGLVRSMAAALKHLGEEERRWLHGAAPENTTEGSDNPFADLTEEQLDYITEHGKLPPDVDPARFYGNLHLANDQSPVG